MVDQQLRAPFPYFGGKSAIAAEVWRALGQPKHYVEPFFGSGAVLLARPGYRPDVHVETVNDKDGHIANVWRSIQFSPDEVAKWCDWPVNHADLAARKGALIENEDKLLAGLIADPEWHDPVMAGYWVWAACCWIGSGLTKGGAIPHVADAGRGVHRLGQVPHVNNAGRGAAPAGPIYEWMHRLSDRLRRVRVVCGDWSRVCGGDWHTHFGDAGVFFDPPYAFGAEVYHKDSADVSGLVREWCLERGARGEYRIVLAGYDHEHPQLLEAGWTLHTWSRHGGYANQNADGNEDRHREALYLSPTCAAIMQQETLGLGL